MEETCILCGDIIPEGRQVCPICEQKYGRKPDERKAMDFLLRQSVLKGPPGGKEIIIHGQFMGDTLKCPDTIAYDAAKKQRHWTAFRQFFDFLNAFFISGTRRTKSESNHYCSGKSEGRHGQNHYVRQFGRRISPGRKKGAAG